MSSKKTVVGLILVLLGILLLFRTFDVIYFTFGDFIRVVVPLGLITAGAWMIIRRRRDEIRLEAEVKFRTDDTAASEQRQETSQTWSDAGASAGPSAAQASTHPTPHEAPSYEDHKVRYSKFLGDMYIDCDHVNLQNVEISTFVGDVEIKLRGGELAPGLNRMIISGFLGDLRIFVPTDMAVFANCSSFVGDIEVFTRRSSGFGNTIDGQTANYRDAQAKLYIAANSFVGDIRVRLI